MKTIEISVWNNKGKKTGSAVIPDTLEEMITMVGDEKTLKFALKGFVEHSKRILRSGLVPGRKKVLKITLKKLTDEQLSGLIGMGFLEGEP